MYVVPSFTNEIKVPMTNWTAQKKRRKKPANKFNCAWSDEEEILCIIRKKAKKRKLYQNRYFILGLLRYICFWCWQKNILTHTWNKIRNEVFVDITQFYIHIFCFISNEQNISHSFHLISIQHLLLLWK